MKGWLQMGSLSSFPPSKTIQKCEEKKYKKITKLWAGSSIFILLFITMAEAIMSFKIISSHIHHKPSFQTTKLESKSVLINLSKLIFIFICCEVLTYSCFFIFTLQLRQLAGSRFISGFHLVIVCCPFVCHYIVIVLSLVRNLYLKKIVP